MGQSVSGFTLDTLKRKKIEKFRKREKDVRIHQRLSALLWLADGRSLDEVAGGASREFQEARETIVEGAPAAATSDGQSAAGQPALTPEQRAAVDKYRSRHADLASRWDQQQLSLRDLRKELVKYYIQHGCQQLDERFGSGGQ